MAQYSISLGVVGLVLIILGKLIDVIKTQNEKEEAEIAAKKRAEEKAARDAAMRRTPEEIHNMALSMSLDAEKRRLEEAVKLRPDSADLHTKLGLVCLRLEQKELARQNLEKAIDLGAAGDMLAYLRLGEIYITEKRFDSAAEVLRRGLDGCTPETPTRRAMLVTYATAAGVSGDTETARRCFDEAETLGYTEATSLRQRLGF